MGAETKWFSPSESKVIIGGMGVGITDGKFVSAAGIAAEKLGKKVMATVSGTGLAILMINRLQNEDLKLKRILEDFPVPGMADSILNKYTPEAKKERGGYLLPPKPEVLIVGRDEEKKELQKLLFLAGYAELRLAQEGHNGPVAYNVLTKVNLTHLVELYGAIWKNKKTDGEKKGASCVIMGAGMPYEIPEILDKLSRNEPVSYRIGIGPTDTYEMRFDPKELIPEEYLKEEHDRPDFFIVVSHPSLTRRYLRVVKKGVNGVIYEGPLAGGHVVDHGELDYDAAKSLNIPSWVAGGQAGNLQKALDGGLNGIQAATGFLYSAPSGLRRDLKNEAASEIRSGTSRVDTNKQASPARIDFQVFQHHGTLSEQGIYKKRKRVCKYGYLVDLYKKGDGEIGFRCPAGPVTVFERSGGNKEETIRKQCLCEGLVNATEYGHGPAILTSGKNVELARSLLEKRNGPYPVEDAINAIFEGVAP